MSQKSDSAWLLLLPQLPPQPSSLRVRVWRRLQQIGAVAVKNAAYALPDTETALEENRQQWIGRIDHARHLTGGLVRSTAAGDPA